MDKTKKEKKGKGKMKKAIAILLAFVMVLPLVACGGAKSTNQAFEMASNAFEKIDEAYKKTEQFGEDLYEAWRVGIYDKDDVSVSYLADELSLSRDDINAGIASLGYEGYEDMFFYSNKDNMFSACVWVVKAAYQENGTIDEVTSLLSEAKNLMKEMSDKYSDYEHYPNLKGYYTTTNAFFEFCQNPTGSFEQVKDTINDYRNDARDYRNDIAYIFEE